MAGRGGDGERRAEKERLAAYATHLHFATAREGHQCSSGQPRADRSRGARSTAQSGEYARSRGWSHLRDRVPWWPTSSGRTHKGAGAADPVTHETIGLPIWRSQTAKSEKSNAGATTPVACTVRLCGRNFAVACLVTSNGRAPLQVLLEALQVAESRNHALTWELPHVTKSSMGGKLRHRRITIGVSGRPPRYARFGREAIPRAQRERSPHPHSSRNSRASSRTCSMACRLRALHSSARRRPRLMKRSSRPGLGGGSCPRLPRRNGAVRRLPCGWPRYISHQTKSTQSSSCGRPQ